MASQREKKRQRQLSARAGGAVGAGGVNAVKPRSTNGASFGGGDVRILEKRNVV